MVLGVLGVAIFSCFVTMCNQVRSSLPGNSGHFYLSFEWVLHTLQCCYTQIAHTQGSGKRKLLRIYFEFYLFILTKGCKSNAKQIGHSHTQEKSK